MILRYKGFLLFLSLSLSPLRIWSDTSGLRWCCGAIRGLVSLRICLSSAGVCNTSDEPRSTSRPDTETFEAGRGNGSTPEAGKANGLTFEAGKGNGFTSESGKANGLTSEAGKGNGATAEAGNSSDGGACKAA